VAKVAPDDRWDLPLRLLAALHFLALSQGLDVWRDPVRAIEEHADDVTRFATERSIQTNEVQRSWLLLPCFLETARRAKVEQVDLIELGPSAGLNLVWDRYRYRYELAQWGDTDVPLELAGEERGRVPASLLRSTVVVRSRIGIDLDPVDVTTDEGATLLKSFVWADQRERLERLDRAIALLRDDPPELVRGDLVTELPRVLGGRRSDGLTLVFETAVLGYLSEDDRGDVLETLERAAESGPLALVRTAQPPDGAHTHYGLWIRLWPGERDLVGLANFHGAWLDWLA